MSAIPVSELGLNSSESRYLQQQIAAASTHHGSNSSSRAASHASSQGRLLLDPSSLQALSAHFDRLMYSIQQRWQYLTQQTQTATQVQYDRAGNAMQMADAEIARFRAILREIDELQVEFDKVRRIGEIVKGFKSRVDRLDRRL
ncbi:hypothetical protein BDW02DRAFT_578475 [Decorospora gaudefroyi]|uniref:Biogenesis of lysosome-related organelles complex 1 subunit CNL1 n=1 Tax=Decorospora gaudefroyi TaxID=184978 RepID=A0A6A5KJC3_9PLEO|nr:hypothetical protein BDW02DRAFT_578475 [Decorospora gaudefroyi]